jgi:hypothetical protein
MCEHLQPLENYLIERKVNEYFRGKAWSENCREWIYFDCVLKTESLKLKFNFPTFVVTHENLDIKSGMELGLVCNKCQDAIMGFHPNFPSSKKAAIIQ